MRLQSQRLMANTKALLLLNRDPSWSRSHQQGLFFIIRCVSAQCAPCKAFVSMLHATVKPYHSCSSGNWVNAVRDLSLHHERSLPPLKIGVGLFSSACVLKYFSPVHYSSLLSFFFQQKQKMILELVVKHWHLDDGIILILPQWGRLGTEEHEATKSDHFSVALIFLFFGLCLDKNYLSMVLPNASRLFKLEVSGKWVTYNPILSYLFTEVQG